MEIEFLLLERTEEASFDLEESLELDRIEERDPPSSSFSVVGMSFNPLFFDPPPPIVKSLGGGLGWN